MQYVDQEQKNYVEAAILEIRNEAKELPIDGSFTGGSRGHLLITIDSVLLKLGFNPGYIVRKPEPTAPVESQFMTREDLVALLPFEPWASWNTPYFTMDKLKAMVAFRLERVGDKTYEPAALAIKVDMEKRKQEKKKGKRS